MDTENYYFLISGSSSVWWNCFGRCFVYKRKKEIPNSVDPMVWLRMPFSDEEIENGIICIIREKYPVQRINAVKATQ